MKLKHTFAACTTAALLLVPAVGNAQDTYYVKKVKPKVTDKVKPKHDATKPYKFKVSGKIGRKSASKSACKGTVKITIKKGKKTVGKGNAKVKSSCKWSKSVKSKKAGKLKIHVKFGGNGKLKTATGKTLKVTAG